VVSSAGFARAATDLSVVRQDFIYETAPFPSCHASTIAEVTGGLVAAWFGGQDERAPDVGIWVSRNEGTKWTAPVEVANGIQTNGTRLPTWNPVLFQPKTGPLLLFYKVGPSPSLWWGMIRSSTNSGRTWGEARRLPAGFLGPIKNKPVQLPNGDILCPSSSETDTSPSQWRVHFERTSDLGETWSKTAPTANNADELDAIQPSILLHRGAVLQAVGRTRQSKLFQTWSQDNGLSWSAPTLLDLPNPNSGTDAVTLKDGRHLLVYNHTAKGRSPLNVALSRDGKTWRGIAVLENTPGEYSYPAVIQTSDGLVHVTYTWKRERIRHAVLDPKQFPRF
jgi:predicted neuraminidase